MRTPENDNRAKTTTEFVTRELRDRIYRGELEPGLRLRQAEIARLLNVSVTPVREAFFALLQEGILTSVAHKGVAVLKPSLSELIELYAMRIALESMATKIAVASLTPRDIAELEKLLDRLEQADRRGEKDKVATLNHRFHMDIYVRTNMPRLIRSIDDLRRQSMAYIRIYDQNDPSPQDSHLEHRRILSACANGDAARAADEVAKHLEHTKKLVSRVLESMAPAQAAAAAQ